MFWNLLYSPDGTIDAEFLIEGKRMVSHVRKVDPNDPADALAFADEARDKLDALPPSPGLSAFNISRFLNGPRP